MIYKVTKAEVIKSSKGHEFFCLTLNNSITVKKIFPFRNKKQHDDLYQLYCQNNGIDFLVGKYIYTYIENTQYGYTFDRIDCFDIIDSFKNLISSYETPFSFYSGFYDLLKRTNNRKIQTNGTLRLNFPYDNLGINKDGICYQLDHKDILNSFIEKLDNYKAPFRMNVHFNIYDILKEKKYGRIRENIIKLPHPYTKYEVNEHGLCYLKSENLYGFVDFDNISLIYNALRKMELGSTSNTVKTYELYKGHISYSYTSTKRYSSKVTGHSSGILLRIGDLISKKHYDLALK